MQRSLSLDYINYGPQPNTNHSHINSSDILTNNLPDVDDFNHQSTSPDYNIIQEIDDELKPKFMTALDLAQDNDDYSKQKHYGNNIQFNNNPINCVNSINSDDILNKLCLTDDIIADLYSEALPDEDDVNDKYKTQAMNRDVFKDFFNEHIYSNLDMDIQNAIPNKTKNIIMYSLFEFVSFGDQYVTSSKYSESYYNHCKSKSDLIQIISDYYTKIDNMNTLSLNSIPENGSGPSPKLANNSKFTFPVTPPPPPALNDDAKHNGNDSDDDDDDDDSDDDHDKTPLSAQSRKSRVSYEIDKNPIKSRSKRSRNKKVGNINPVFDVYQNKLLKKKYFRVRKKLKQIAALENKKKNNPNFFLIPNQQQKIDKKSEYLQQKKQLQIQLLEMRQNSNNSKQKKTVMVDDDKDDKDNKDNDVDEKEKDDNSYFLINPTKKSPVYLALMQKIKQLYSMKCARDADELQQKSKQLSCDVRHWMNEFKKIQKERDDLKIENANLKQKIAELQRISST